MFGLTEKEARDQKAATFIGRLALLGQRRRQDGITEQQYDAANDYLGAYEAFQRAVKSPDALRSGVGGGDQGESPNYASWCQRSIAHYEGMMAAVRAEQNLHRGANFYAALDYLVLRGESHWHMVGDLRLALNAIGHFTGSIPKPRPALDKSDAEAA